MNSFVVGYARLPVIPALHVLFGGNHASKCSRYFEREEMCSKAGGFQRYSISPLSGL